MPKNTYDCITFNQRKKGPQFCIFYADAKEIFDWARADPLSEENPGGTQRLLSDYRVKNVQKFFSSDPRNSIPTAVVIGLPNSAVKFVRQNSKDSVAKIEITRKANAVAPGLIIDGQHRIEGSRNFTGEPIALCVVALIGTDSEESAFQFLVINNKGAKVSRDHLKNLNLKYDQKTLSKRLAESAGLGLNESSHTILTNVDHNSDSPFYKLLAWPSNSKQWVAPQAIELAYQHVDGVKRELKGTEVDFFLSIWIAIKRKWPNQWKDPKDGSHKLLQKVSIFALTKLISEKLFRWAEFPTNPVDLRVDRDVQTLTNAILDRLEESFWSCDWQLKELDTTLGRNKLLQGLQTIYDNKDSGLPWNQDIAWVSLPDSTSVPGTASIAKSRAITKTANSKGSSTTSSTRPRKK